MKRKEELNIVLVQVRQDAMKEHEYTCVVATSGITDGQLSSLDVFQEALDLSRLSDADVLVIGGAGDYCLSQKDLPMQEALLQFTRDAVAMQVPVLGACYGAHVLTEALGGEVVYDPERAETGTYEVTQKPAASQCPIFSEIPDTFFAQFGHKDHMGRLPEGAVHLASSELSLHQAWTLPGQQVYAVQFHPELGKETIIDRLDYYADQYGSQGSVLNEIRRGLRDSPHAQRVLELFLDRVVLQGATFPVAEA